MTKTTIRTHHAIGDAFCYACDARSSGVRDRRPEGGITEAACARHADPTITVREICCYCDGATRKGSLVIDGEGYHAKCHAEQMGAF